jgi:glycosyltransferase involved in cell wall biosynthesis
MIDSTSKTLTIGIPTYNRPTELLDSVQSLVDQLTSNELCDIEILVSDNCSLEDSNEVLFQISRVTPNLKIYRNDQNFGYDRNINNIFEKAQGLFVVILADDDRVKKNSLSSIYRTVVESQSDIILFETDFFDSDLLNKIQIEEDFFVSIAKSKFYPRGLSLLEDLKVEMCGGITGFGMRRSLWLEADPKRFFDSNWIHLGVLLKVISNSSVSVIREKYFDYRMDNKESRWKELYVSLGIASIYSNSGLLDFACCQIGYKKYRIEYLISILRKKFNLRDLFSLTTGTFHLHQGKLGYRFLMDFLIILFAIITPKWVLKKLLLWRFP